MPTWLSIEVLFFNAPSSPKYWKTQSEMNRQKLYHLKGAETVPHFDDKNGPLMRCNSCPLRWYSLCVFILLLSAVEMRFLKNGGIEITSSKGDKVVQKTTLRHILYAVELKIGPRLGGFRVKNWSKSCVKSWSKFFHSFPIFIVFFGYVKNTNSVNLCQNSVFAKLSGCQE